MKKNYTPCPWYVQDASPDLRTKYPPRWKGLRYEVVRGLGIGDTASSGTSGEYRRAPRVARP